MTTVVWPHRASPFSSKAAQSVVPSAVASIIPATRSIRIVMAGGGTGGHLYPGLAVAEALQDKLGAQLTLLWAATPRPVDQRLLSPFGENYIQQPVQPLVKKLSKLWAFWSGWRQSCGYWRHRFTNEKIDAVVALGGYAAGPAAYVARQFRVPVALLNPDATPGLANRFLLKRADRIFSQWPLPAALTTHIPGEIMPLGCPIRQALIHRTREDGAARLGLDPSRPTLVITGGSLAAKSINDAMIRLLSDPEVRGALAGQKSGKPWQVLHLAGSEQSSAVRGAYEPIKDFTWQVQAYRDDMASVYAVADLVIGRAGASTCAELTACGVASILLPYPYHRDLHQRHNAMELVKAGAAVCVDDEKDAAKNAAGIKKHLLSLLYEQDVRARMAGQARAVGKPYAAAAIAEELLALLKV